MSLGCLGMNPIPATYKMINETDLPPKPNSLSSNSSSLRRTLSAADMSSSSHKWLIHSSMKRAQSSQQLDALGDQEQENNDHDDRLRIHQEEIHDNNEEKKGAFDDIWSSILSSKKIESGSGSGSGSDDPPYVHPLVKRTTSSLSEKSLEICTESLGSETGSDGFGSEESDSQQPELHEPIGIFNATVTEYETTPKQLQVVNNVPLSRAVEYETNYCNYKRAPPTPKKSLMSSSSSFPPPLPSLSHRMRSHRQDGRLVVEAVSVPTTACLRALRRDGRLLLTLSSDPGDADVVDGDNPLRRDAQDFNEDDRHDRNRDDVDDDERKELTIEFVMEEQASCRMIMSKVIGCEWRRPRNFNTTVIKDLDNDENEENSLPSVIPSVNAYEYYWRRSDGHHATAVLKQFPSQVVVTDENGNNKWVLGRTGKKITAQAQAQIEAQQEKEKVKVKVNEVVVEKAAEYLVPFLRGCKEPRRSLLFWEPHCIATS